MKKNGLLRWLGSLAIVATLSFTMQTEASAKSFTDVPTKHPYHNEIKDIESRGLIGGYPDGTFKPSNNISRKHVAQLLSKALELESTGAVINYKDVPKNHAYYDAISKVTQAGIFGGNVDGKFNPDAPLTRVQMAKVLDIAFELNIKSRDSYDDIYSDHWGYMHVQALSSNGITTGDNGRFKPNQPVTRAHYAVFLSRALKNPGVPKSNPNSQLTKAGIINLIHRVPTEIEAVLYKHKANRASFNRARPELLTLATQTFTDDLLKDYYAHMCTECDGYLFSYVEDEMNYRFEIIKNTATSVRIRTVEFDVIGPNSAGGFLEYAFEKQAGKWKLADYEYEPLGAGSLALTKEEAIKIIKDDYKKWRSISVNVRYVGSSSENYYDWYTDRSYRRVFYKFDVTGSNVKDRVLFYPHSGRQE